MSQKKYVKQYRKRTLSSSILSEIPIFPDGSETDESIRGFFNVCNTVSVSSYSDTSDISDVFENENLPSVQLEDAPCNLISQLHLTGVKREKEAEKCTLSSSCRRVPPINSPQCIKSASIESDLVDKNYIEIEINTPSSHHEYGDPPVPHSTEKHSTIDASSLYSERTPCNLNSPLSLTPGTLSPVSFSLSGSSRPSTTVYKLGSAQSPTSQTLSPFLSGSSSPFLCRSTASSPRLLKPLSRTDDVNSPTYDLNAWSVLPPIKQRSLSERPSAKTPDRTLKEENLAYGNVPSLVRKCTQSLSDFRPVSPLTGKHIRERKTSKTDQAKKEKMKNCKELKKEMTKINESEIRFPRFVSAHAKREINTSSLNRANKKQSSRKKSDVSCDLNYASLNLLQPCPPNSIGKSKKVSFRRRVLQRKISNVIKCKEEPQNTANNSTDKKRVQNPIENAVPKILTRQRSYKSVDSGLYGNDLNNPLKISMPGIRM